jgi:enoyl-[acyl-carrier-protein] reductase (NADH)
MKTRIHIWHDQNGKIIAVGKPAKHMVDRVQPMAADISHSVISTDVEDDAKIKEIHQTHFVDVANCELKRKK